jgi:Domain of unknown function (DUF5667)
MGADSGARGLFRTPNRRRAEEFGRLLDAGRAAERGASIGTSDPVLAPLVGLAAALRALPLGPTPEFRDGLRQRLVAVAAVQTVNAGAITVVAPSPLDGLRSRVNEWAGSWRGQRRLMAATAAMSAVALVGGIGLAGSRSLPGDPFYGVKRQTEALQLTFTFGTEAKGERHLEFARTRMREVQALVHDNSALPTLPRTASDGRTVVAAGAGQAIGGSLTSRVVSTLADMDAETEAGTRDLTAAYASSHDKHPLNVLLRFSIHQYNDLVGVYRSLPVGARPQARTSYHLISTVAVRARDLLAVGTCTSACGAKATAKGGPGNGRSDNLGPKPCSCVNGGGGQQPGTPNSGTSSPVPTMTPGPTPTATETPGPNGGGNDGGGTANPTPSPTPTTLDGQLGSILSQLPLPVTPPPLPLPTLPPVHLPPVHLPTLLPSPLPTIKLP